MNIQVGTTVKTLAGVCGFVTKVEMKSHHGEVWYDLRIKLDDIGDRFGTFANSRIEYHGLEKDMYKYFESVDGESLQEVNMSDFKVLQEQVIQLTKEVRTLRHRLDEVEVGML